MLIIIPFSLRRIRGAEEPNSKMDEVMFIIWGFIEHEIVPPTEADTPGKKFPALLVIRLAVIEVVSISTVIPEPLKYISSFNPGRVFAAPHPATLAVDHELVMLQNNPFDVGLNIAIS